MSIGGIIGTGGVSQSYVDSSIAVVNAVIDSQIKPNQRIEGQAVWVSGLDYFVTVCKFTIAGVYYTTASETVTLATADGTNPRIDVIVAETDGTAGVVTGTPAANPVKPEIDSDTQVEITFAQVAAGATTPSNVSNEDVYLENTEWTTADSGATIDPADTSDPYAGTKAILFNAAGDSDYLTLTDSAKHSASEFDRLVFYIKNTVANTATRNRVRIALYNSTTNVSSIIDLRHNTYNFDGSDVSNYQLVSIPIADFALGGSSFDVVRFQVECAGSNTLSFLLDNIKLQIGAVPARSFAAEIVQIIIPASDETTALSTGTARTFRMPFAFVLTAVRASVGTAPTGSTIIIDIKEEGTTIFSTKLTIDATEKVSTTAATPAVISDPNLADFSEITIIIDQVGSSVSGAGLKIYFYGYEA